MCETLREISVGARDFSPENITGERLKSLAPNRISDLARSPFVHYFLQRIETPFLCRDSCIFKTANRCTF